MLLALSYIGSTINDQSQVTNDRLQYKHDMSGRARNVSLGADFGPLGFAYTDTKPT
jgi:hypothetical protein